MESENTDINSPQSISLLMHVALTIELTRAARGSYSMKQKRHRGVE
jgi:hypothetical protein